MWKLVQNDISYSSMIPIALVMLGLQIVLYALTPFYKNANLIIIMLFAIVIISAIIERGKSGINRQCILLPHSVFILGISRSALILSPWLFLIAGLFIANNILFPSITDEVYTLIGQLGFVLILTNGFVLIQDIYFSNPGHTRVEKITKSVFLIVILISASIAVVMIADSFDPKLMSGYGITLVYLWGIIISFFTVLSFVNRKSYI